MYIFALSIYFILTIISNNKILLMTVSQIQIEDDNDDCLPVISGLSTAYQPQSSSDIQYQEVLLLSNANIYISDFKKFYSQTEVQQSGEALILPSQKTLFYLSVGYLSLLIEKQQEKRINELKQMILDCDFQKYRSQGEQLFQLLENGINIKVIGIKIINTVLQLKSVYELLLNYDIDNILQFIFKCILKETSTTLQQQDIFQKFLIHFKLTKIVINDRVVDNKFSLLENNSFELISNYNTIICRKKDQKISIATFPKAQIQKYIRMNYK